MLNFLFENIVYELVGFAYFRAALSFARTKHLGRWIIEEFEVFFPNSIMYTNGGVDEFFPSIFVVFWVAWR